MKYYCTNCNSEFYHKYNKEKYSSKLVFLFDISCPYCNSDKVYLTEHGKLLIDRRVKIEKIENKNNKGE